MKPSRIALFAGAALLFSAAIIYTFTGGSPNGDPGEAGTPYVPRDIAPLGHSSGLPLPESPPWEHINVSIGGDAVEFYLRKHDPPIRPGVLLQGNYSIRCPYGALYLQSISFTPSTTLEDTKDIYNQYHYEPIDAYSTMVSAAEQYRGWDNYLPHMLWLSTMAIRMDIVSEVVVNDYYLMIARLEGRDARKFTLTFISKRLPDGEYRNVMNWNGPVGKLMEEGRLYKMLNVESLYDLD